MVFDYESTQEDELSLQVGDILHNVREVSGCSGSAPLSLVFLKLSVY